MRNLLPKMTILQFIVRLSIAYCILITSISINAATIEISTSAPHDHATSLWNDVDILQDPSRSFNLDDVTRPAIAQDFHPDPQHKFNFGISRAAVWARMDLANSTDQSVVRILEIEYARLAEVDFYVVGNGKVPSAVHTGYMRPATQRAYPHRNFVFPIELPAGQHRTIYLRVISNTSLEIPLVLWSKARFSAFERIDYMVQAAFYGLVLGSIFYNFLLWILLRESNYLRYLAFVIFDTAAMASASGIGMEYLWPDLPGWTNISFAVCALLAQFWLISFMRQMVGIAQNMPRMDRVFRLIMVLNLLIAAVMFHSYIVELAIIMTLLNIVLIIPVIGILAFQRHRAARIFLLAFSILLLGAALVNLRLIGILPTNFLTVNGLQIGAALETILLAYALADRFNEIRNEKENLQHQAIQAERHLVETLSNSERRLEHRVKLRTEELTQALTDLHQTQHDLIETAKLASLGALVAGVAHELNTPIGNALVTASVIEENARALSEQAASGTMKRSVFDEYLRKNEGMAQLVVRSCQRAALLIDNFKRVAVQANEETSQFNLRHAVEEAIQTFKVNQTEIRWTLEINIAPEIMYKGFRAAIGQVIGALLYNVDLHAFSGSTDIIVSITAQCNDGIIELHFHDNGAGIDPAIIGHIFDPFFTTAMGKSGGGLGLTVVRNIVVGLMKGSIEVESAMGEGSRFILRFPSNM